MYSLFDLNARQLDETFARGSAGTVPEGRLRGTALLLPGTPLARGIARAVGAFAWKGKTVAAGGRRLYNRITPFALHAVPAEVYVGDSLLDERPCIVIDYSRTSAIAWFVRDELREVEDGLYLGKAYALGTPVAHFALERRA